MAANHGVVFDLVWQTMLQKNHPGSNEIGRTCTKFKKYLQRLPQQNES
jgi:hypothetical protein